MIRHSTYILLIVSLLLCLERPALTQEKTRIRKIVIDAGHGGKDPGAIGRKAKEKNITLAISLKLGNIILKNMRDVDVIYTRDSDVFVELFQRAEIANHNKADLFISIHCNSNPSHSFQGAETYVMGLHKTRQNLEISKIENAAILMEPDYLTRYDGFDPGSDESYITFTLFQNAYLNQSTEFAARIQDEMKDRVGMDDRGVRQAGFLVLYKTTMPAVLIETGFLSNPVEESYLMSETGQDHIANAIYRALSKYRQKLEKTGPVTIQAIAENTSPATDNKALQETVKPEEIKPPPAEKQNGNKINKISDPDKSNGSKNNKKPEKPENISIDVWFSVQIATAPKDIGVSNSRFKGIGKVSVYHHGGLYKYIVGKEADLSNALQLTNEMKKKGFRDAFVVAFRGDERITIGEAKSIMYEQKRNQ